MAQERDWFYGEQTLDEMLADPIVRLMMRSDGVTPDDVREVIQTVSAQLREQRQYRVKAA